MTVGSIPTARNVARRAGEALARTRLTRVVDMSASLGRSVGLTDPETTTQTCPPRCARTAPIAATTQTCPRSGRGTRASAGGGWRGGRRAARRRAVGAADRSAADLVDVAPE